MMYLFSIIEVVAFVAAMVFGFVDHNWAHGTFFIAIAMFTHLQFESYEADRRRELLCRARGEKPPRRSGLPWASYYT